MTSENPEPPDHDAGTHDSRTSTASTSEPCLPNECDGQTRTREGAPEIAATKRTSHTWVHWVIVNRNSLLLKILKSFVLLSSSPPTPSLQTEMAGASVPETDSSEPVAEVSAETICGDTKLLHTCYLIDKSE